MIMRVDQSQDLKGLMKVKGINNENDGACSEVRIIMFGLAWYGMGNTMVSSDD